MSTEAGEVQNIIESPIEKSFDVETVAEIVVEAARKFGRDSNRLSFESSVPHLHDYPGLMSNSIEDRTITFKRLASDIALNFGDSSSPSSYTCALLAASAFLVGRGTTHSFLLRPIAKRLPAVFTWFGLIAALAGPRVWDVSWSRATKGVERLLRAKFEWTDPPVTDICWAEYSWMANTFDGVETFSELPKMLPKVLSIEILPGVACQLRLSSGMGGGVNEAEQKLGYEMMQRNEELKSALMQFINFAMKSKYLIDEQGGRSHFGQQSLGLADAERSATKSSRSKRSK